MAEVTREHQESTGNAPLSLHDAASLIEDFLPDDGEPEVEEKPTPESKQDSEEQDTEEGDKSESEDAEDEEQPETPPVRKHRVKVGEEELEVEEPELIKGYQRQQDYTRKTQAVAEERKAVAAEKEAIVKQNAEAAEKLAALDDALKAMTPREPDWEALRKTVPADKLAAQYISWQEQTKKLNAVSEARKEAEAQVARDRQEKLKAFVKEEHSKLIEAIPEWKDTARHRADMAKLAHYALNVAGFTREELSGVTDHRVIKLLRAAQLQHEAHSRRPDPKRQSEKPGVVTKSTGKVEDKKPVSKATRALQSHAKLRTVHSAAAAIEALLPD